MADLLATYRGKRDFERTAEPAGTAARRAGYRFVVQKHAARRLHWDFRLEADGVLKSWAVTRGPSSNPADKRLAVRTEDHPIDYADFEGTIPAGEYGGGTVMLWDSGTWAPVAGKSAADIDDGHLHFVLHGTHMQGEWLLVRMKPRPGEKRENWLLRKVEDSFADSASDDLAGRALTSVTTDRTMDEIAAGTKPPRPPKAARKGKPPAFRPLQLATLVDSVPTGNDWLHEVKYDGYRAEVAVGGGKAVIRTRTGLDWTERFAQIATAAAQLPCRTALIDGEICALDAEGRPDFGKLQAVLAGESNAPLTLFAFDLLESDGVDLTAQPNVARKEALRALLADTPAPVVFAEHIVGAGEKLFDTMCASGYEGIISKRAAAHYTGRRTSAWLKVKCLRREEFAIIGWTKSPASRAFGALLLATRNKGELRYVGKVGTGFGARTLDTVAARLRPLERATPAAAVTPSGRRGAHWVEPELVAEIAFADTTADGLLRHASFVGLRDDKPATDVRRDVSVPPPAPAADIRLTHGDRVIFPGDGLTKRDLAHYYHDTHALFMPGVAGRLLSLVRCPQGRAKECFFQKHDSGSFGPAVLKFPVTGKAGKTEDYIHVDTIDGVLACVQMGTIEFHGWGSRVDHFEQPDRMVFDLDPDTSVDFSRVKSAAVMLRDALAAMGLASFAMLSGGKGIHVIVPLTPAARWPAVADFASRFARAMASAHPERFVATMSKAKRADRIFIDWLRNQRGATAVAPYSARARAGAPVAAPVTWTELGAIDSAARYSIRDAAKLIDRANSVLAGWGQAAQQLPDL